MRSGERMIRIGRIKGRPVLLVGLKIACTLLALILVAGCAPSLPGIGAGSIRQALGTYNSSTTGTQDLGPAHSGKVSILLRLRDPGSSRLPLAVSRIYDPRSRYYGRFVKPARFRSLYGPQQAIVHRVHHYIARFRLTASAVSSNPWMTVQGSANAIDRAFKAKVHRYLSAGKIYLNSAGQPTVPSALRSDVLSVAPVTTAYLETQAVPGSGLSPTGIMNAYDISPLTQQGIDGAGQTVVFIEVDGIDESALSAYAQKFHLPPFQYAIHGPQLKPGGEATMDLEVVHAIAPKARLVVYNLPVVDIFADLHQQLSNLIVASQGDIFSESLAICARDDNQQNAQALQSAYAQADAAGEAVFAATGDSAAFGCISQANTSPAASAVSTMIPASCPGVTAVGGTRLSIRGNGSWYDETVWEDPLETGGTGGGATHLYARPSWQRAPGIAYQDQRYNTSGMRLIPDVSADADPASGMTIDYPSGWANGGGTSQATPIWAAITALIDEYLVRHHHRSVGWLNPALYSLARSPQAYPPFHDVTVGTNLYYAAAKGYDMATGLGTPDAWNLARDLARYQSSNGR